MWTLISTMKVSRAKLELFWCLAQRLFPILASIALWTTRSKEAYSVMLVPFALWKLGIPETIVYIQLGISSSSKLLGALNLLTASATTMHHVGSVVAYVFVYMEVLNMHQASVTICLFAIFIHLGLLLMEFRWILGVAVCLVFEIIFQWEIWAYMMFAEWPMNLACGFRVPGDLPARRPYMD